MINITPPYYAVVFSSELNDPAPGYDAAAAQMEALAAQQPGFLGIESSRERGFGITVSYWQDLPAITAWKNQAAHLLMQQQGQAQWYRWYRVNISKVERAYEFSSTRT